MKLAIYHNLPSGGGLYHLCQVVDALKEAGHELMLHVPSTAEIQFEGLDSKVKNMKVWERPKWTPGNPLLNPISYRRYLESLLAQELQIANDIMTEGFDGVYLGQCQHWTEPPLLRFLSKKILTVLYCQEPKRTFHEERFLKERESWPWAKKIWRLPTIEWMQSNMHQNILGANRVLCNSRFSQGLIAKAYPGIEPKVSSIGVKTEDFSPPKVAPKPGRLITVGALDPSKNHGFALEVAGKRPGGLEWEVNVVTDRSYGNTAEALRSKADELGVNLVIHERVTRESLVELYGLSFACVYFPIEEPFGIVSLESQSCGTPVIGVDEGGVRETLKSGVGGFRMPRDVDQAVSVLEEWLEEPEAYEKLRSGARNHVLENWRVEERISETREVIEESFLSSSIDKVGENLI